MKISKLASAVFAVVGTVLLTGSIIASFAALSIPAKAVKPTQEANRLAQKVLGALDDGDFSAVEGCLYGKPTLGLDREPATTEGKLFWDAYRDSVAVTTDETCYGEGTNIYQTARISAMDIPGTLDKLGQRAGELLKQRLDSEAESSALLWEDGQISQTLRDEIRMQALQDVLAEPETVTTQITFQLVEQDGQWWAVPDQAMLDILSGGLS